MTKIEERADEFSAKWLRQDQVQISYDGYMQGAKDQQKYMIEKACKSFCTSCDNEFCPKECSKLQRFKKRLKD